MLGWYISAPLAKTFVSLIATGLFLCQVLLPVFSFHCCMPSCKFLIILVCFLHCYPEYHGWKQSNLDIARKLVGLP